MRLPVNIGQRKPRISKERRKRLDRIDKLKQELEALEKVEKRLEQKRRSWHKRKEKNV